MESLECPETHFMGMFEVKYEYLIKSKNKNNSNNSNIHKNKTNSNHHSYHLYATAITRIFHTKAFPGREELGPAMGGRPWPG